MADTDLLFADLPIANPSDLVFGGADPVAGTVLVSVSAALPGLTGVIRLAPRVKVAVAGTLPGLSAQITVFLRNQVAITGALPGLVVMAEAKYYSGTERPLVAAAKANWQTANPVEYGYAEVVSRANTIRLMNEAKWQEATASPLLCDLTLPASLIPVRQALDSRFDQGSAIVVSSRFRQASGSALFASKESSFERATPIRLEVNSRFQTMLGIVLSLGTRFSLTEQYRLGVSDRFSGATALSMARVHRYQNATWLRAGKTVIDVIKPPFDPCYLPNGELLFWDQPGSDLVFICERHQAGQDTVTVPVRRYYMVLNNVVLKRLDGNITLPATSLNMQIDMDSFAWRFSASLPASAMALIEPGAAGERVLLEASVNGAKFMLIAEEISRDSSFGKRSLTLSGRGLSAELSETYSPVKTFQNDVIQTAQQIMLASLTSNGVPIGWDVDWRITDWSVPAKSFTHQGTYMSAVIAVATAAGAFIQPHPTNKTLRVRPRWPALPWEMQTAQPGIELPSAAVVREGLRWEDKPQYNGVYVSGTTTGGVLALVKRANSAADYLVPMITDPLITDPIAARARGIAELASAGRNAVFSLSLPVLNETGIIECGTLLKYDNKVGVVTSSSLDAKEASLRQTIELVTHG